MPQPSSCKIQAQRPENPGQLRLEVSPWEAAQNLQRLTGLVFLDTASGAEAGARSLLAARPTRVVTGRVEADWGLVEQALDEGRAAGAEGGLFGWVGFDGAFTFGVYPEVLVFDYGTGAWSGSETLAQAAGQEKGRQRGVSGAVPALDFQAQISRAEFIRMVERAQEYIAAGDIYQVNLSHPWEAVWSAEAEADPLAFYERLRQISPAPFAAYLDLDGCRVFCSSPESFLRMRGREIETCPIKGTRPRFPHDLGRDEEAARELAASPKERAELLMITDLERNDLGMACEYGSVYVPELAQVQSFAQVFHLVSTVRGTLRVGVGHAEAFRLCFPGGSISGAPKKRALEIIHELETHPRGLYTGAIGYFGFGGESQFNIAIRTAVQQGGKISFHTGAGIVSDSVPALEYEETLHKAAGLLRAAAE